MIDTAWLRTELAEILPKAQHKKIDRIVGLLSPEAGTFTEAEMCQGYVGVETVQRFGLDITLDAHGDATAIRFPYGAEVTG
jgi:hypothetical protein